MSTTAPADMVTSRAEAPARSNKFPSGVPYIIGNEAAERFSFYGMKAILQVYLTSLFLNFVPLDAVDAVTKEAARGQATARVHIFIAGVYAFPMIGAILADRLLGKYRVIMGLSLVYCAGHAVLALYSTSEMGMYTGLALIAVGSGGIKPCVSANVGDQFTAANSHLVTKIYQIFYFSINFGSFFSTLMTPWLLRRYGADVAFGVPGILMGIATLVFWLGRNRFIKVPPKPAGRLGAYDSVASIFLFLAFGVFIVCQLIKKDVAVPLGLQLSISAASLVAWYALFTMRQKIEHDTGFFAILLYSMKHQHLRKEGMGFFDVARERFGAEAAEGPPAVLKIAIVFSMVSVFWALFDQHSSTWIRQAEQMDLAVTLPLFGALKLEASQISAMNPAMVMVIIPFLNFALYPVIEKIGIKITPLRKMTTGMVLSSVAFIAVALLQKRIDDLAKAGELVPVFWQVIPYLIMTTAEVLVSVTGLEFAYTQAPRAMKSTIMGFWLLTVTMGNVLVAFLAGFKGMPLVQFFWVFAGLMAAAALIFAALAYLYKGKTYLQQAANH
jgi:POT family proton-dependent oligopeptide transporter